MTASAESLEALVRVELGNQHTGHLDVVVHGFSAEHLDDPWTMPSRTHLATDARTSQPSILPISDVVVHPEVTDAPRWVHSTLRKLPGCQVAAAQDAAGWYLASSPNTITCQGVGGSIRLDAPVAGELFASVVREWLFEGRDLVDIPRRITLRLAAHAAGGTVTAEVVPDTAAARSS